MLADRFGNELKVGTVVTYPYRQSSTLRNVDGIITKVHEVASGLNKVRVKSVDPWSGRLYETWVFRIDRMTVLPQTKEQFEEFVSTKLGV